MAARGITLPRSVLNVGMLSVLMRERMPHQPTSVKVLPMAGSEYMVEHKNGVVPDQLC